MIKFLNSRIFKSTPGRHVARIWFLIAFITTSCSLPPPPKRSANAFSAPKIKTNVESLKDGFAIWMPVNLETNGDERKTQILGEQTICRDYFARGNGGYWLVQVCDFNPWVFKRYSSDEILDRALEIALDDSKSKVLTRTEISLDGNKGIDVTAKSALRIGTEFDGTYRVRIFLVNHRVYRVANYTWNPNVDEQHETTETFLNSFRLFAKSN
jgi:hypothetical protein